MSSTTRRWAAGLCAAAATAAGFADPYWVAWEGDDYPENQGWERIHGDENGHGQGGAERSIQDGVMTIDSTRHHLIYDGYVLNRLVNPDIGETFQAEWRLRVTDVLGPQSDVKLHIARDGEGIVSLEFGVDHFTSEREGRSSLYTAGEFHTFLLTSTDMLSYTLSLDGQYLRNGVFDLETFNKSFVAFGDASWGGTLRSRADWDYVRFGVIPEPATLALVFGFLLLPRRRTRSMCLPCYSRQPRSMPLAAPWSSTSGT